MENVTQGDRVKILEGVLEGAIGIVSQVNRQTGNITVMVSLKEIAPEDRKGFVAKRTRYGLFVPLTLMDGEWERFGSKTIIT